MDSVGRIKKEDIGFILAQMAFIIFSVIRFYDHGFVVMRNMPFLSLKNIHAAIFGCAVYYFVIILFSLVSLAYSREEKKKQTAYLLTAMSIVMIPVFLPENYLGVVDMYSSILGFLCLILLHSKYLDRLVGVVIFLMVRWDITAAFTWGLWLLAFVFYLSYRDRESVIEEPSGGKKNALLFAAVLYVIGCAMPRFNGTSYGRLFEPRFELSVSQAVIVLLLLLPFAVLFIRLIVSLARETSRPAARISYYTMFLAAFPAIIVWFLQGDYYRGLYYMTAEPVLAMLMLVEGERIRGVENPAAHVSVWDSSRSVRVFLLLYLAFTVFFLMYGRPLLLEEVLLKY